MNYYNFFILSSVSILVPLVGGFYNIQKIGDRYLPFFYFLFFFSLNEIITISLLTYFPGILLYNCDLYYLLEPLLIFGIFQRWGLFKEKKRIFMILYSFLICCWCLELYYNDFSTFLPFFNIIYGFVIVIMSICMINKILSEDLSDLIENPVFVISCIFLIFFIYNIVYSAFLLPGLQQDNYFKWKVYTVLNIINLICNLGYAFAIYQIIKGAKIKFTR
jgi:hypothetical protein